MLAFSFEALYGNADVCSHITSKVTANDNNVIYEKCASKGETIGDCVSMKSQPIFDASNLAIRDWSGIETWPVLSPDRVFLR